MALARPATDREPFEDIVVDLAGSGAIGIISLSTGARCPKLAYVNRDAGYCRFYHEPKMDGSDNGNSMEITHSRRHCEELRSHKQNNKSSRQV